MGHDVVDELLPQPFFGELVVADHHLDVFAHQVGGQQIITLDGDKTGHLGGEAPACSGIPMVTE